MLARSTSIISVLTPVFSISGPPKMVSGTVVEPAATGISEPVTVNFSILIASSGLVAVVCASAGTAVIPAIRESIAINFRMRMFIVYFSLVGFVVVSQGGLGPHLLATKQPYPATAPQGN